MEFTILTQVNWQQLAFFQTFQLLNNLQLNN